MVADISLDPYAKGRMRFVCKPRYHEVWTKDRSCLSHFESGSWRNIKHSKNIWRYHNGRAESKRRAMRWEFEGICGGGWWKIITRPRIETLLAIRIKMERRREEQKEAFPDPRGDHRLQIIGIFFGKVVIAFNTCVGRYGDRRFLILS